ncbi:MAG TPA: heavy metal translocating P-type ATPase, partial [Clostridiaceae bacterium]|nr:heavy metal translocating P-type ATPase [Clostridiaceae bacterium]
MNKEIVKIGGMTCAACASRIEKVLGKKEGVLRVSVNFATEKATVEYDPQKTRFSEIKQVIEKIGYEVINIEKKAAVDEDKLRKEKEIRTLWRKFIIAAIFTAPLLYLAMVPMISWLPFPIPGFLEPMHFPLRYALTQLALVIPVIIAGNKFYTVGYKALIQRSPNMDSLIAIGTTAAVIYSLYSTYQISIDNTHAVEGLYFETAGVIITLILLMNNMRKKILVVDDEAKIVEIVKSYFENSGYSVCEAYNGKEAL